MSSRPHDCPRQFLYYSVECQKSYHGKVESNLNDINELAPLSLNLAKSSLGLDSKAFVDSLRILSNALSQFRYACGSRASHLGSKPLQSKLMSLCSSYLQEALSGILMFFEFLYTLPFDFVMIKDLACSFCLLKSTTPRKILNLSMN